MFMLLERDVVLLPLLRQLTYVQVASKKAVDSDASVVSFSLRTC